jgi:hypothetical protein
MGEAPGEVFTIETSASRAAPDEGFPQVSPTVVAVHVQAPGG